MVRKQSEASDSQVQRQSSPRNSVGLTRGRRCLRSKLSSIRLEKSSQCERYLQPLASSRRVAECFRRIGIATIYIKANTANRAPYFDDQFDKPEYTPSKTQDSRILT